MDLTRLEILSRKVFKLVKDKEKKEMDLMRLEILSRKELQELAKQNKLKKRTRNRLKHK